MKKLLYTFILFLLILSFLAGCGNKENTIPQDDPPANTPTVEELKLTDGAWVAIGVEIEGESLDEAAITEYFGSGESVMVVAFAEDNTYAGLLFDDFFKGSYTQSGDSIEFTIDGEEITSKATLAEDIITMSLDGGSFTLKHQSDIPKSLLDNPWMSYKPTLTAAQTSAMSSFMCGSNFEVVNSAIYGLHHTNDGVSAFAKTPFEIKDKFPTYSDAEIIDEVVPYYPCSDGEFVYYIADNVKLCRVKIDGNSVETLYEDSDLSYLQLHNDRLFFTNANYNLCSIAKDGGDVTVEIDRELYYPYFICGDWMIFQDDEDGERIHLYNLVSGDDLPLTEVPSYNPIIIDHYLYYLAASDGGEEYDNIARVDMLNPEDNEISPNAKIKLGVLASDGNLIIAANGNGVMVDSWRGLSDMHADYFRSCPNYMSDEYQIYLYYNENELIYEKTFFEKSTGNGRSFR